MAENEHENRTESEAKTAHAETTKPAPHHATGSSPAPHPRPRSKPVDRPVRSLAGYGKALVGMAVGAGLIGAVVVGLGMFGGVSHTSDTMSQADKQHHAESEQAIRDGGGFNTQALSKADAIAKIQSGAFGPASNSAVATLLEQVQNGEAELRELAFFDSRAVDNDQILVQVNGVSHQLTLAKEPTPLLVPYVRGSENLVSVTGLNTDEGPVTPGIVNDGREMCMRALAEGEVRTFRLKDHAN